MHRAEISDMEQVTVTATAMDAITGSHAICVLTEWDEFKSLDFVAVYQAMVKPAFVFDGRNILDHAALREMGFIVYGIGKPMDPFVRKS